MAATADQVLAGLQTLATSMAQASADAQVHNNNMTTLITQLGQAMTSALTMNKKPHGLDTRALLKPKEFTGKEREWPEWKTKAMVWIDANYTDSAVNPKKWLIWAEAQQDRIEDKDIAAACNAYGVSQHDQDDIKKFDRDLKLLVTSWMGGHCLEPLHQRGHGPGRVEAGEPAVFPTYGRNEKECADQVAIAAERQDA